MSSSTIIEVTVLLSIQWNFRLGKLIISPPLIILF